MYYGFDARPISQDRWIELLGREDEAGEPTRRVGLDRVGRYRVSTVWLGLDHQYGDGPPLIFESMTFDDGDDGDGVLQWRYGTWEEAEAGHREMVRLVRRSLRHRLRWWVERRRRQSRDAVRERAR